MEDKSNNRIAKNTLFLYIRMGLVMLVGLYTSRVVLQQLGVVDYGIYGVVGGVVALFTMLSGSMAASTQRFLTVDLGRGDLSRMNVSFNTAIQIHLIVALLFVAIIEPAGLWFMKHEMQIPPERMHAAVIVFQCSIVSTIVVFLTVPYTAMLIAHERMNVYAGISIIDVLLKLVIAFALMLDSPDKLVLYAVLMAVAPVLSLVIYFLYCRRKFDHARMRRVFDRGLFGEMMRFAGWSLWGNTSVVLATQGLNILLNVFFGPVVNAARGVAVQVQTMLTQFSTNFQTAVNPQITKNCASQEYAKMYALVIRSSKITLYLLLVMAVPLIVEMPFVLDVWLGKYPAYSVPFASLILITSIVDAVSRPVIVAVNAKGEIKRYQIIVGGVLLLTLPVSYVVLKLGGNPTSVFVVNLCVMLAAAGVRLVLARPLIGLPVGEYLREIGMKGILVSVIAFALAFGLRTVLPTGTLWSLTVIAVTVITTATISFFWGLNRLEREFVLSMAQKVFSKLRHKK